MHVERIAMYVLIFMFGFNIRVSKHILPTITHISVVTLASVLIKAGCLTDFRYTVLNQKRL
jgi:disulfide bond formation protein DsbB